jgi:hypothetical protein
VLVFFAVKLNPTQVTNRVIKRFTEGQKFDPLCSQLSAALIRPSTASTLNITSKCEPFAADFLGKLMSFADRRSMEESKIIQERVYNMVSTLDKKYPSLNLEGKLFKNVGADL